MMRKFLLSLLFLFPLLLPWKAFADDNIQTAFNITYAIQQTGNTHTTANVVITNTTPNLYVSTYTLKLGFTTVENLKAFDSGGSIVPVIQQTPDGEEISLKFNTIVYGKGTTLPFTISFDTPDIASRNGTIWEVNIPGLKNQNDFTSFNVHVVTPPSFGKATYIKPDIAANTLDFTKDQLGKSGISLAFGSTQYFSYSLDYHLQNKNVFPITTEIALPPTTNYQDVSLEAMTPKPKNVRVDQDGNWLATYYLLPSEKKTITASGHIALHLLPTQQTLSDADRKIYLQERPYWQLSNSKIQQLAKQLKTPEAIYDYVVSHLSYDFSRVNGAQERVGAAGVLQNPTSAVCLEFTDLFIAIARAAGIPAREVDGFANTQNSKERPLSLVKDVLHAWPQYYDSDSERWIMVDPTWGNTTGGVDYFHVLDFDHVAFAIKGVDSSYPVPAGGYKLPGDENKKDIAVMVSSDVIPLTPQFDVALQMPDSFLAGLPIGGTIAFTNTGTTLIPAQDVALSTFSLSPKQQIVHTTPIPPFGSQIVTFTFNKSPILTNRHDQLTIATAGKSLQKQFAIVPITRRIAIIGGLCLAILSVIIFIITRAARDISASRRK